MISVFCAGIAWPQVKQTSIFNSSLRRMPQLQRSSFAGSVRRGVSVSNSWVRVGQNGRCGGVLTLLHCVIAHCIWSLLAHRTEAPPPIVCFIVCFVVRFIIVRFIITRFLALHFFFYFTIVIFSTSLTGFELVAVLKHAVGMLDYRTLSLEYPTRNVRGRTALDSRRSSTIWVVIRSGTCVPSLLGVSAGASYTAERALADIGFLLSHLEVLFFLPIH